MGNREILVTCLLFAGSALLLFRSRGWRGLAFLGLIMISVSIHFFAKIFWGAKVSWLVFGVFYLGGMVLWRRLCRQID
jgi:hypothetical protein